MEDRKRPALADDEVAPPTKRQATAGNGAKSRDEDLPNADDLERYQKDAIIRRMKEYKREKGQLETLVADLQKRSAHHDDHLRIIDSWFSQLLDEVKVMAGEVMSVGGVQPAGDVPFHPSLLFSNNETFQEHLLARSKDIKSTIATLFDKLPSAQPEVRELQNRLVSLLGTEKTHLAELHKVNTEKEQLSQLLENATTRYMVSEKKLDRAKSKEVARLERQATAAGRSESISGPSGDAARDASAEANGVENGVPSAESEAARLEAMAAAEKRKEQIQQLEEENKKLTEEITRKSAQFASLTDEDYSKTELFKLAKSQQEDLISRINDLEAVNNQLREEAQRMQAEKTMYRVQMEEESRTAVSESEAQMARLEADLARIRNQRDEFQADISIRRAAYDQQRASIDQIKELTDARESRISALESEIERLRLALNSDNVPAPDANLDSMSVDDLKAKVASLERANALLANELPAMETAWKRAQALATKKVTDNVTFEEQLSRQSQEKARADQKYFAAMKTKESREVEIRTLRAQNSKSSEIMMQLKEAESATRSLLVNLEKQFAEAKEVLSNLSRQNRGLEQKASEAEYRVTSLNNQIAELKKLLAAKDSSTLEAARQQKEAEVELEKMKVRLEETKRSLEGWKKKGLGDQSQEYEALRSLAVCNVCKSNFKDTCLKSCGHVLCKDCVQERIQSRSRKCPICGKSFGANDFMHVTL